MVSLKEMRKQYGLSGLNRKDLLESPTEMFRNWFEEIEEINTLEPNSMTLATATASGKPTCRVVLLKEFDGKGFIFYTNYESSKGMQIDANPYGSLTFNWHSLERQVRIRGKIRKISIDKSKKYFASRPRMSQISVLASKQSEVIDNREILEKTFKKLEKKYKNKEIPMPEYWGGYRLEHKEIEFWQGRRDRLHDRFIYTQNGTTWRIERLAP
jgi:pyridoxamine 5'-phosphate oxidase